LGATVGYLGSSWTVMATYYPDFLLTTNAAGTTTKYLPGTGGSGMEFSLGYMFSLGSSLAIGPQLIYNQWDAKRQEVNGVGTAITRNEYSSLPAVGLWWKF
jgi:hypothetical protein